MYCPRCATRLTVGATRCHECRLDVRPVADLLDQAERPTRSDRVAVMLQRRKHQRRAWGNLLIMCSLFVGCLIPISIALFSGFGALSSLVIGFAGLAGVLLIVGTMLLMAADNVILAADGVPFEEVTSEQTGGSYVQV